MAMITQRLALRPMTQRDAPALFAILGNEEAMRFWHRPAIRRLEVVEEMVREQIAAAPACCYWTVFLEDDPIGSCDLSLIDRDQARAETGFLFRPDRWGHGYAGEAMAALADYAFDSLDLDVLVARTHVANKAARRVLEKLGFTLERVVQNHQPAPGIRMDCALYVLRRTSITQNGM
jgi:ribosomal-protein-alanine N-acetyltransferase